MGSESIPNPWKTGIWFESSNPESDLVSALVRIREQRYVDTPKRRIVSFQFTDFFLHSTFLISHLANFLLYFYLEFIHPILRTKSYQVKAARPGRPCFHFNIVAVPHWQPRLAILHHVARESRELQRQGSPVLSSADFLFLIIIIIFSLVKWLNREILLISSSKLTKHLYLDVDWQSGSWYQNSLKHQARSRVQSFVWNTKYVRIYFRLKAFRHVIVLQWALPRRRTFVEHD